MRFLKKKIALSAQAKSQDDFSSPEPQVKIEQQYDSIIVKMEKIEETSVKSPPKREKDRKQTKEDAKSTKTVVKNYGKAIASFAISHLAVPYLTPLVTEEKIKLSEFVDYIGKAKESIEGIDTFRALLLTKDQDDKKIRIFKKLFQAISEVFIKYFSVNWIFSGRMVNKQIHLKFRFKMLRRIQNPELFTYLK